MKKLITSLAAIVMVAAGINTASGADAPQKAEMRSAWVATVWQLDWPTNVVTSTGNASQIDAQKKDMIRLLDSLHVNNLNAINFQVRSRCDAMYKSSYEPWSTDLVSRRGLDPGYDPLEFVVAECHKRGMECHAWLNPYRYESVKGQWSGGDGDYRSQHPDWLLDVGGASILNPGKPEVTQRICDIIAEIVTNYDIDGVLFDDYFYLSKTTNEQDGDLYEAYLEDGGTLSQADWRRDNVNRMVASVYKTIKSIKPYVRFGVSPAGIACTSQSVARGYGISPCPTGSDWQYNDIYSDPIAWISQQSLDFISPQIYWTIGNSTDYDKATEWWSGVADKWKRHMYVSHDIATLNASSKMPGASAIEESIAGGEFNTLATGPNSTSFEEYANEVRLNREYTLNDAPGSIFYSCKYLYKNAPLFAHYLHTTVFNTPALIPAMDWFAVANPGNPTNVSRAGANLSWSGPENVRYTVYAVPTSVNKATFNRQPEYLLGVSYTKNYTIPDKYLAGYDFAVCVYDRYGNEYTPVFVGVSAATLAAPQLIAPIGGSTIEQPFDFEWKAVEGASNYIIEISDSRDMSSLLYTKAIESTSCSSNDFYKLPSDVTLYWRVRSCGMNHNDGISATESFVSRNLEITYPADGMTDVSLTATVTWSIPERDVTLEVSSSPYFETSRILYTADASGGKFTFPKHLLSYYTTYFVRLQYVRNGQECQTPVHTFTTVEGVTDVPAILHPVNGGTFYGDDNIRLAEVEGSSILRIEVSENTSFNGRTAYVQENIDPFTFTDTKKGNEIIVNNSALKEGSVYYIRARASFQSETGPRNTEWSPVTSFTYSTDRNGVDNISVDKIDNDNQVELFDLTGKPAGTAPSPGLYIVRRGNVSEKTVIR